MDVYDQVFSLDGGKIYERSYDAEHRINQPEIKKHIHQISQKIAFWIFENNADKAFISRDKFQEICDTECKDIQGDVLIGNYFKLIKHCEGVGTDELQFVHRSIYEYFVAVYFFECIYNLRTKKEVAGMLGELLKEGQLSEKILEYIKHKFDGMKDYNLSEFSKDIFNMMLRDGMTYYTRKRYKNIIVREMSIFTNMLKVVHLWNFNLQKIDNSIVFYFALNKTYGLNLRGVELSEAELSGVYLSGANLKRVDFSNADLISANLISANLSSANLSGAYLREADLTMTIFDERQVKQLCKKYDLSNSSVFISETEEIISYKKYAQKKKINI